MGSTREETQAFFAERAAGWDTRFPDDGPRYAAAVEELGLHGGNAVLDLGCGTGRAADALRGAVGPDGRIIAIDVTAEMLDVMVARGRRSLAAPVLADGSALPLASSSLDAVLAAGFLPHVDDPRAVLAELARVVRRGGRLALFHFTGRSATAYGDIRDEEPLRAALEDSGWVLSSIDDGDDGYLAMAECS